MLQTLIHLFGTISEDGEFILNLTGYISLAVLMVLILIAAVILGSGGKKIKTKQLVFAAMAIALAMVTSYIKVLSMPFGGSITLFSMFFICLIGYLYGPRIGLTTAVAYGIFQLISDPYIIHPAQLLFDYILGFGALGLSGFFSKSKHGLIKGCAFGMFGRFVCSTLSGIIFFADYAPATMNPIIYSLLYNASYILTEAGITIVILCVPAIMASLVQVKKMALEN